MATAMPEGPNLNPLAIGLSIALSVALAIVAAYCLAISAVGTSTHAIAPSERSWSWYTRLAALLLEAQLVLLLVQQQCQVMGLFPKIHLPMAENPRPTGPPLALVQHQRLRES